MDISGNSTDNVHNGNTLVNGDLVVRGNIFDEGGQEGIPDVERTDHVGLTAYAGTNPATGGVINIVDRKYILKKHGNWRIMSGLVDLTLSINGFNYFSLSFDTPAGDTIPTTTSVYLNGGMSSNVGGNSPNFIAQSAQVSAVSDKIIVGYVTHDKALWPQSQSVPTTVKYSVSYLTTQSDPNTEVLEAVPSYVENPMVEQLDANNFNIVNVNNIQASTFNGGLILTNPLTADLGLSNNNIVNVNNIESSSVNTNSLACIFPATELNINNNMNFNGYDIKFPTNITGVGTIESTFDMYITGGPLYLRSSPSGTTGIYIDDNLNFQYPLISKILNCNEMKTTGQQLRLIGDPLHLENATGGTDILVSNPFNMNSQDIKDVADIGVQSISSLGDIVMNNSVDFNQQDLKNVVNINGVNGSNLNITNVDDPIVLTGGSSIELRTNPPGGTVETYADLDMKSNDIKEVANVSNTSLNMLVGTSGTLTLDGGTSRQLISSTQIQYFAKRFEETNSQVSKVDTVHIYDASGFTETVLTLFGNDYYILKDNCTYIIHDQITVTNGFNFGINTAIRGESLACSITFDESTKDICGFRASNEHLFLSDITVIGGGGHFTSSTANVKGLFDFSNFNTGASAPFYGRNKRCRIQNVQIIAPYSLGKLQGGGTLRLLGNFINGGGAQPTGIYTRVGLEVSDGLSFEFCNNKVVLMAGAQTTSTMKMLDFVDATLTPVTLGFNAVIVSGNIFHPRDQENGINFANRSITALGTIGANTFIRTGGTAPLINYERATIDNNYNKSAIINYEVNGNAGVIDVLPTCLVDCDNSNSVSSATFTDITFPVANIRTLNGTKRFGLKSFVSGVTGGDYTTGNYIRDTANANNFAYILEATLVLAGTNRLILIDFNNTFTSVTNYEEVDKDFVLTGVTSTAFNFGTTSNNECELYYFDKDPADLQITVGITHNNSTTNDEVQFAFAFDDGSGYVLDSSTTISVTNPRPAPRSNTSTITTLKRFVKGNQLKVQYRYIDVTTSVIDNLLLSVH